MTIRVPLEEARVERFFGAVHRRFRPQVAPSVIVITHLLEDRPFFLEALSKIADVRLILAKPKSIDHRVRQELASKYPIQVANRSLFNGSDTDTLEYLNSVGLRETPFAVLDIGGYFAPALRTASSYLKDHFLGVVEDTENGHKAYELAIDTATKPVYSVARSPLKDTEDFLVGQAVLHSAEHVARTAGHIFSGRRAAVIGFGKIGRSIAEGLRRQGVVVGVYDMDPIMQVRAKSLGFAVLETGSLLPLSDIVVGATGGLSMTRDRYESLKNGAFLFTVTSSDSELEEIPAEYQVTQVAPHVELVSTQGKYFYLFNRGNAVNFLHGAVVGDFIYLVQAEILACLGRLASGGAVPGSVCELGEGERRTLAAIWMEHLGTG